MGLLINRLKAFVVRMFMVLHFLLVVWRVTHSWSDKFWLLAVAILPFILDGLYTIFKKGGVEWKLFSFCFFFYLGATLPGIWLLEIQRTINHQNLNSTQFEELEINGVSLPVRLSPDTWVLVVEEMMLYLMILARWFLPRGDVGREQLTQLLFGFIGIASDIMELLSLFDEDQQIRHNTILTYLILAVWSLSILQFTLTFATAHRPRRARGLRLTPEPEADDNQVHRRSVLRVELLATVLSLFMQDGPFLALRLYTSITYSIITYSLVFFTAKNILVIMLLLYKIFLYCSKLCCPKRKDVEKEWHTHSATAMATIVGFDQPGENGKKKAGPGNGLDGPLSNGGEKRVRKRKNDPRAVIDDLWRHLEEEKERHQEEEESLRLKLEEEQNLRRKMEEEVEAARLAAEEKQPSDREKPSAEEIKKKKKAAEEEARAQLPQPVETELGLTYAIGDLQKVLDGPATPAKPMERTKKYDKMMVQDKEEPPVKDDDAAAAQEDHGNDVSAPKEDHGNDASALKEDHGNGKDTQETDEFPAEPPMNSGLFKVDAGMQDHFADVGRLSDDPYGYPTPENAVSESDEIRPDSASLPSEPDVGHAEAELRTRPARHLAFINDRAESVVSFTDTDARSRPSSKKSDRPQSYVSFINVNSVRM